jgi:uncharacterized sulfatase
MDPLHATCGGEPTLGESLAVDLIARFGVTLDEVSLPPFMEDTLRKRQARANFLYEICLADRHLARMLASLEERGLLENTLVVVTSDNGTAISDGSQELRGKASPYDLGCHVPLAMMWPARVPAGRTVTDFVSFADFAPTFLEAAGLAVPAGITGRSLLPILASGKSGRVEPGRDFIITGLEWHGEFDPASRSCRSIRDDRYAYLVRYANVDDQGRPLDTAALVKPVKAELDRSTLACRKARSPSVRALPGRPMPFNSPARKSSSLIPSSARYSAC